MMPTADPRAERWATAGHRVAPRGHDFAPCPAFGLAVGSCHSQLLSHPAHCQMGGGISAAKGGGAAAREGGGSVNVSATGLCLARCLRAAAPSTRAFLRSS